MVACHPRSPRALSLFCVAASFGICRHVLLGVTFTTSTVLRTHKVARASYESGKVNLGVETTMEAPASQLPVLECNDATKLAIIDCLEQGCSVEALMKLDEVVARDEKKVQESIEDLRTKQKTSFSDDNAETLGWLENYIARSGSLRGQLQAMKGLQDVDFVKQLVRAASVGFGGGRPNDYPKVGVAPYSD